MASILQSIKVNAAIEVQGSTYTAPATGYAIVQIYGNSMSDSGAIGGRTVFDLTAGSVQGQTLYIGPSQTISLSGATITGVEFINTT